MCGPPTASAGTLKGSMSTWRRPLLAEARENLPGILPVLFHVSSRSKFAYSSSQSGVDSPDMPMRRLYEICMASLTGCRDIRFHCHAALITLLTGVPAQDFKRSQAQLHRSNSRIDPGEGLAASNLHAVYAQHSILESEQSCGQSIRFSHPVMAQRPAFGSK